MALVDSLWLSEVARLHHPVSGPVGSGRLPGVRSRIVGSPSDSGTNDTAPRLPLAVGPPTWVFAKVMVSFYNITGCRLKSMKRLEGGGKGRKGGKGGRGREGRGCP